MTEENKQHESIAGRLFSPVTLLFLVGCFFLGSGFMTGVLAQYFWGVMIIAGAFALRFVRKKDWKKHWEERDRLHMQGRDDSK